MEIEPKKNLEKVRLSYVSSDVANMIRVRAAILKISVMDYIENLVKEDYKKSKI